MKCCCGSIFYNCHFNFYDVNSRYLDFALLFFFNPYFRYSIFQKCIFWSLF